MDSQVLYTYMHDLHYNMQGKLLGFEPRSFGLQPCHRTVSMAQFIRGYIMGVHMQV